MVKNRKIEEIIKKLEKIGKYIESRDISIPEELKKYKGKYIVVDERVKDATKFPAKDFDIIWIELNCKEVDALEFDFKDYYIVIYIKRYKVDKDFITNAEYETLFGRILYNVGFRVFGEWFRVEISAVDFKNKTIDLEIKMMSEVSKRGW